MLSVLLSMCLPSLATDTVATVGRELAKARLIAAIDELGGGPVFRQPEHSRSSNHVSGPIVGAWLRAALTLVSRRSPSNLVIRGNDDGSTLLDLTPLQWMHDLEDIAVVRINLTQADLEAIAATTSLRSVTLADCGIRDDDLKPLSRLVHLEHLGIVAAPNVDGSGFGHLTGLKSLKSITLEACGLSDDGVKGLGAVKSVELLYMPDPKIGDHGIRNLSQLKNLKMLSVGHTRITDEAVSVLNGFPKIELIDLSDTQIGDCGIRKLERSKSLKSLGLNSTKIGVESLRFLKSFPSVEYVEIGGTPALAVIIEAGWTDVGPTFSFPDDLPAIE